MGTAVISVDRLAKIRRLHLREKLSILVFCRNNTLHVFRMTSDTLMSGGDDAPEACGCGTHVAAGGAP